MTYFWWVINQVRSIWIFLHRYLANAKVSVKMENLLSPNTILHFQMKKLSVEAGDSVVPADVRYENESFKIRVAHNGQRRATAQLLVQKLYGRRGYQPTDEASADAQQSELDRITLMVNNREGLTVGTVTIAPDGPQGLMADTLYRPELDQLRGDPAVRLLEYSKLAIDRHFGNSQKVVAMLFNMAYIYVKLLGCNRIVIEVNPRHVSFYQSSLGFKVIGEERLCPRVNAPAVLLMLEVAHVAEQVHRFEGIHAAGRPAEGSDRKNLYRYSLSEEEEKELTARIVASADTLATRV